MYKYIPAVYRRVFECYHSCVHLTKMTILLFLFFLFQKDWTEMLADSGGSTTTAM